MSANSSTHSHHSNQPLVSGRTSSDGQRQNSQPQHNLPQRDLYASSSPTTTHINVGGGGGGSVQNPLMPPGSRRATILDLPPSRRDSKRASVVGPPTFSPKYGNLALLTSADDGAPLPLDDLSPTNNNNRRATDASSVSSSDSKHRQREPREHSNVSTQLQELTPKEIIEAERRLAAQQAAHSAIQNVEKEEERNLTLWEQAQWNAKVYAVVESGSFPSDIPYSVETAAIVVALLTAIVILLSCTSILALSYPQYVLDAPSYWSDIEVFCVVIFTLDLVLRCLTCPNKVRFLYDFFNWVDVISILPYYVGVFGGTSFPWYLRIIRAMRIARLVKVLQARGILGLKDFLNTIQESIAGVVLYFIVAITGLLVFSTLMYFSERGEFDDPTHLWWRQCTPYQDPCVYPNLTTLMAMANVSSNNTNSSNSSNSTFVAPILNSNHTGTEVSPFQSISGALWFTINTMTTTGTGEVEGTSSPGKLATAVMGFAGVFFIGLPVMILAGNHEAHGAMSTVSVVRNTWAELHRRKRRLAGSVLCSLEIVRRYFGWSPAVDEAWKDLQATVDAANGNIRLQPINQPAGAADKDQQQKVRAAVVVGYYRIQGMLREIRMSMVDPDEFLFEPLYMLLKDERGRPKGRVIWSRNGLPTIVEFRIVLEDEDTRNAVAKVAGQLNPNARICCDSHSGLQIRHTSPLDALRTQEVGTDGTEAIHTITRWTMLPVVPRPGFRDRTFPIYFKRTGGTWDSADAHQDDEYNFSEEEIVNDALSSLLGSGLLVESYIPIPPVRRRLMVVTQFLQQTRLHRALELCAHRASRHVPFHKLTAYITDSDFVRLLEGVGRRLELVDPSLAIEDLAAVERAVADVLLDRLRKTKVVQIPVCFRRCLYNSEVLEDDDIVYEVPLSLFVGDEEDEVEQDSVGYVEVTARAGYGRAVRVEFMIGMGPQSENGRPRVESFVTATAST